MTPYNLLPKSHFTSKNRCADAIAQRLASRGLLSRSTAAFIAASIAGAAEAQRVDDNAVGAAEDAFGLNIGNEQVGVYTTSEVRGFSPILAGNVRIEGLYIDRPADFTDRLVNGSTIKVGLSANSFLFPAPTGIVDYRLRKPGAQAAASAVVTYGPLHSRSIEFDATVPIIGDTLGMAAGASILDNQTAFGTDAIQAARAISLHWRPMSGVAITPFWSEEQIYDREPKANYISAGPFLPPQVVRARYTGPDWAKFRGHTSNMGLTATVPLATNLQLATGLFRSVTGTKTNFAHLLVDVTEDGEGRRLLRADPPHRSASWSGEARLSRTFTNTDHSYIVHLSIRGRDRATIYGGSTTVDLGRRNVEEPAPITPKPDWTFAERTFDSIRQWTGGIGYEGQWRGRGSLTLGLQRTSYRKVVEPPGLPNTTTSRETWLYNASLAAQIVPRLIAFGGVTRGLEESGIAPDNAANRTQALPAILTEQRDLGLRWTVNDGLRAVVGLFEVKKPYFAADERNVHTQLGDVTNRGVELSLAGKLTRNLDIVAGAILLDPRVSGQPVDDGRIGSRPVGQTRQLVRANLNYALSQMPGLTLTASFASHSRRYADRRNLVETPNVVTLGFGTRYLFRLLGQPALFRMQANNLTDAFEWRVIGDSAYDVNSPRSVQVSLTVDF